MKPDRGYFRWKGDEVVWVSDEKGYWLLDPIFGLRHVQDHEIICGIDLMEAISDKMREKIRDEIGSANNEIG
jgi:hypothetical protein